MNTDGTYMLELPLPPRELNAHNKGHWRVKRGPIKRCRERAHAEALVLRIARMARAEIDYDFYWPDLNRRDTANAIQSCKPYVDGLVDAGVLEDDNWRVLSIGHVRSHLDRANPRVVLTLRSIEEVLAPPPEDEDR